LRRTHQNAIVEAIKMDQIQYLKVLALLGCDRKKVKITAKDLESDLETSGKTIARNLKTMEEKGFIEREVGSLGQSIKITPAGMKLLSKEFADYKKIFQIKEQIELGGTVVSGLGEGQYYVSIDGYSEQFQKKLGFKPYPGTLNVKINENCLDLRQKLNELPYIKINGFSDGKRTYGASDCYPVSVGGVFGYIIVPERTHYRQDLLEIIAPVKMRTELNLKDGDEVSVIVGSLEKCG